MSTPPRLSSVPARRSDTPATPEGPEQLAERRAAELARVGRFIGRLQEQGYFGKVTLKLQNGHLVELCTEQVLKIEGL